MTARAEYDADRPVRPPEVGIRSGQMLAREILAAYMSTPNTLAIEAAAVAIAAAAGYLARSSEITAERFGSEHPHVAESIAAAIQAGRSVADMSAEKIQRRTDAQNN